MRRLWIGLLAGALLLSLIGCGATEKTPKIGVSMGVGAAVRWVNEKQYMEERAKALGAEIEVRLNTTDEPTQTEDCRQLIDSGIDVLILTPRNASEMGEVLAYAKEKNVKVINYARVVLGETVDMYVGYDCDRVGQSMGQFLSEMVYEGDYILLKGSENDNNATFLYDGAMKYIDEIRDHINVILDADVPNWDAAEAERMVREAVAANGNRVDAILAPNDKLAEASRGALDSLGISAPVVITGMDAELAAAQRIAAGTQAMTVYMNLEEMAHTAVEQACNMVLGNALEVNTEYDNQSGSLIPSNLIAGQVVTKENLDKLLIDSGYFTHEEVYGSEG